MINKELLDFIRQNLKQGSTEEQIRITLRDNGWQDADVTEAFKSISSFSISNKNILIMAIAALIIIAALFAYFVFFRQSGPGAPMPTISISGTPKLTTSSSPNPVPTASVSKTPTPAAIASANPNALGPKEIYLAYKQQLYYRTKTGEEVFALFAKYRVALIYQQWKTQGVGEVFKGSDGTPNDPKTIAAFIKSLTIIAPDPARIPQELITSTVLNPKVTILHVTAMGGYKGEVTMVLESDGWKVDQESWPTWPVDTSKL